MPGSASLGWRLGWSTHLGLWGRFAGLREDRDTGTLKRSGALWVTEDRPSESASPVVSREQACSAGQVRRVGLASRTGLPFCSQAWPWSSSVARTAQGKKRKREDKNSVAQVFCVTGSGLGRGPRPSPGDFSSLEGVSGIWQMASVQAGEGWRPGGEVRYLIFWAHFMSSALGFSPVRPWIRSSRRRQKPITSSG